MTAKVDDGLVPEAEDILGQSSSVDVMERRRAYEADGWTGFDVNAGDYVPERDGGRAINRP